MEPARFATDQLTRGLEVETPKKRGRKASPPCPDDGPLAAFAHELWVLKCRAGDPSYATMCTRLGAAASKSSLAAATRGTALPSWETTWEFVRVLAVGRLGADPEDTRREWLARWTAAAGATAPAGTAVPDREPAAVQGGGQECGSPDAASIAPPGSSPALAVLPAPAAPAQSPGRVLRRFRPARGHAMVAGVLAVVIAAVVGSLAAASPAPAPAPVRASLAGSDNASFEGDVTFPDGSVVAPGQRFTKVWQLRNTGSLRWEQRYLTRVNTTACQAPDMVPIPVTDPGRSVRIPVPVTAAESDARCKIYWKMTDAARRLLLPDKNPIFLDVVVRSPA